MRLLLHCILLYGSTSKLHSSVVEHLNHLLKDNRSNCSKIIGKKTSTSLQLKRYPLKYTAYWIFITLPCVHTKTIVFRINKQNFLILSLLGLNLHELPLQVLTLTVLTQPKSVFSLNISLAFHYLVCSETFNIHDHTIASSSINTAMICCWIQWRCHFSLDACWACPQSTIDPNDPTVYTSVRSWGCVPFWGYPCVL